MRTLEEQITQYAAYHRDRRNIATHFVGIPMIVFSIVLALSVWNTPLGSVKVSMAVAVAVIASITTSSSTSFWASPWLCIWR